MKQSSSGRLHYVLLTPPPPHSRREGKGAEVTIDTSGSESKYTGDWVDNIMQGRGVATFSNGNVYDGEFNKGKVSMCLWYMGP